MEINAEPSADGVAIVGMSVLLPGAPDLTTYWRNLRDGVDAISEVPPGRWDADFYDPAGASGPAAPDRIYCRRGGFVDEHAAVEPTRFGIMPSSVSGVEPDQLIALQVAEAAILDAGGPERLPARERVGVILGRGGYLTPGLVRLNQRVRTVHQLLHTLRELAPQLDDAQLTAIRDAFLDRLGPDRPESAIGLVPNLAASRIANRLDLRGPAGTVDAACASSLVAVDQAVAELLRGRCDVMLAGGVHHCHDVTMWSVFTQLRALSVRQQIRPFHRDADGILMGEGTGVVVLKRLADAVRDGDRVYAVIRGTGVASDGRTAALASPDPGGQTRALRAAWAAAGLDPTEPDSIGLLEAHGTATPAGDAAELTTLQEVFGPAVAGLERPVLGSVKSMIGHTMPAAGVAGLVKAALAIHHGMLLPTLHCDEPHPGLAATRFRTISAATAWESRGPRRAAVNAFGFGGINAHVVLEQAPDQAAVPLAGRGPDRRARVGEPERVLRLAAATPTALAELLAVPDSDLLASGLPTGSRNAPPCRLAVVDPTEKRLALARWAVERGSPWRGRNEVWFSPQPLLGPGTAGRIAFLFPGLEDAFAPRVADLAAHFGLPMPDLSGAVGDIGRHGAGVVTLGRLLDGALRRIGIAPAAVAGHSVGEWTAMVAGGLFPAESTDAFLAGFDPDALRVPDLAFAALGASAESVLEELAALTAGPQGTRIVLSHDNAPQQAIVCGPREEVDSFVVRMRGRGVLGALLPFRSGFHTPMLEPYLGPIREGAERFEIQAAKVPVWSANTAAPFPTEQSAVRDLFVRHLLEPVRFRGLLEAMHADGYRAFIQLGLGQVTALVSDTLRERDHLAVAAASAHRDGLAQLRLAAAALWVEGAEPDLAALDDVAPRSHPAVRLDLTAAPVSLAPEVLPELRAALSPPQAATARPDLRELVGHFPAVAEFEELLAETERSALALLTAGREALARGTRPAATLVTPRQLSTPVPESVEPRPAVVTLHISTESMPYLLDHCFYSQRPGWPDAADGFPVVPATTIAVHLSQAASAQAPGRVVTALRDLRFGQWVPVCPASEVEIGLEPGPDGQVSATFGKFARGTVGLSQSYLPAPQCWPVEPSGERAPDLTAAQMYSERWMFHGPAFQGVTELSAIGESHVRGVITAPEAPGALLDNVGQILGYWIMQTQPDRTVVFPVGMQEIRFHGPDPVAGTHVGCHVRITELTERTLTADVQLTVPGPSGAPVVWAEVTAWRDRRFDSDPHTRAVDRCVQRTAHGLVQPGGWVLVQDIWPDLATRDLVMRAYLGTAELQDYEAQPPRARRGRLLGRLAVKDAVRHLLWAGGTDEVWPAEIAVGNDELGKPCVLGKHGRVLPDLEVSIAHCAEVAVAFAGVRTGDGLCGVGIDVEEVCPRPQEAVEFALGPDERELLSVCTAAGGSTELWFTRFWAAKEAVAKAYGTGLAGRPRDFAVVAAAEAEITVAVTDEAAGEVRRHRVELHPLTNRPGTKPRTYVVALAAQAPTTDRTQPIKHRERTPVA